MRVRLVAVTGVRVDGADDPVRCDLARDPDPAVVALLEVLAEDGREEGRGLADRRRDRLALERLEHGLPVPGEGIHQREPRLGILPVAGGLAARAVVVVTVEQGAEMRLTHVRRGKHAPDRGADEADRVHRGDRVVQRRAVEHPPHAQEAGLGRHLERALEDPLRAVRAEQPRPHVHEHGVGEAWVVERQAACRVLPAGIEREALDGLPVRQTL